MLAERSPLEERESGSEWDQKEMPFTEHLRELRNRLFVCVVTVAALAICFLYPAQKAIPFLTHLYFGNVELHAFGPADAVWAIFKFSIYAALVVGAPVILYQIWMFPEKQGLKPAYDQKNFAETEKRGKLRLVASPDGRDGSVKIRQDNELYATVLGADETVKHELKRDRHAYVQVTRGSVKLNGTELQEGDGAAISAEKAVELTGVKNAEVLVFDLA